MTASMPPGWTEQPPVTPSEAGRLVWHAADGASVTAVLLAGEPRRIRLSTGPGTCMPVASGPELLALLDGLALAVPWLAGAPDPDSSLATPDAAQPTLFDEVTA